MEWFGLRNKNNKSFGGFRCVCSVCHQPCKELSSFCSKKCEEKYNIQYAKLIEFDKKYTNCTLKQCDERQEIVKQCEALSWSDLDWETDDNRSEWAHSLEFDKWLHIRCLQDADRENIEVKIMRKELGVDG